MQRIRRLKQKKAFTLVEVIIVLVILAILAAVLVPTLTGYIDKAKEKAIISETKGIYTAAQTAVSEMYATYPQFADGIVANNYRIWHEDKTWEYAARITNNILCRVMSNDMTGVNTLDGKIAQAVLQYLDCYKTSTPRYDLTKSRFSACPDSANNITNTVEWYEREHKQPGIIIAYGTDGVVDFVEFGHNGYLCHIDNEGTITVTKNGIFSHYPCKGHNACYAQYAKAHGLT